MNPGWALGQTDLGPLGVVAVALVATTGALAIHFLQRRGGSVASRTEHDLAARMEAIAKRIGLPGHVMPRAHAPRGEGDFVWRDGGGYRYQSIERGYAVVDEFDPDVEAILFAVFRDRCWTQAYLGTIGMDEGARGAEVAARQRAMLALADPAWAERLDAAGQGM